MGSLERLARKVVNGESIEILRRRCGEVVVNAEGDHWSGSSGAWREAVSSVMDPNYGLNYPQLTDWVRAQPSGAALMAVFRDDENQPAIQKGDNDGKFLAFVTESELGETLSSGRHYNFAWLSRHVSIDCEAKIPRGMKVYRER